MKKVLLTGASGYIGSNLVKKLINENIEVHALILPETNFEYLENIKNSIQFHLYDGSTESVFDAVKNSTPDMVFHLASLFLSEHKSDDIINLIKSNVLLGTQLLEAMSKNSVKNFINTGTSWQHYHNEDYNPVNLYAATKQAFEDILKYYTEAGLIKAITLQLFDTYGPADNRPKLFKLLRNSVEKNEVLNMSPGEQLIDLVYIDDVVDAFLNAAHRVFNNHNLKNEVYTVSSNNPISLKDLVELYKDTTRLNIQVIWGGRPYRDREVMIPWTSGKNLPDWFPKQDLHSSFKKDLSR